MNSMTREMKDSGSEWIGKIPKEWEIVPAKSMFVQRNGKGNKCVLQLLSPTQKFGVIPQSLYEEKTGQNAVKLDEKTNLSALKTVHKGDYCISLRSFQGGFELSEYEGVVSPAYQVFYPIKAISQRYYKHLFKTQRFIDEMNSYTMSLRDGKNIAFADFGKSYIPVPPLSEQKRIGNYLDFKCSQIDRLSDNIKQQIEELGEYKKALITQAVTKGLDPDVEMKDSGIAWVGNMPKEWETVPAKSMFMQRNDKGNKYVLQLLSPTQKFGVIPQSLYEEKTGQNAVKLDEKTNLSALKTVHKGDYCISLRSFQGGFELSEYEGVVSPAYQVFYPIKAISQRYYKHLFKTQRFIDEMNSYTMSLRDGKNIAFADFGKSYIPVPPLSEQKRIGNYLDFKCSQIDALIQTKSKTLNVLQEYKKSLILDYVTGKKEVSDSYRKDGCHE